MARRWSTTSIINLLQSMHSNVRLSPSEPTASIPKSHIRESQPSHLGSSNRRGCGISLRVRMTSPLRPTFPPQVRCSPRWQSRVGLKSNIGVPHVRVGSKADLCDAKSHVRFAPRKQTCAVHSSMSALGQKRTSPIYSITSSARDSSACGTVRPSAFAVLWLMCSSTLVTCCTGKSAGLSPLRMRPV